MRTLLHIGVGNFHRAHQAWYTANAPGEWSILGVSLRSPDVRDKLEAQAWRYTLAIKDRSGVTLEPMSIIRGILVAPEAPEAVLAAIASPDTHAITVTVTEKGYALDSDGALKLDHPDIQHDLGADAPRSVIGFLAHGLARRVAAGAPPITVFSCDNLPGNGRLLGAAVATFMQRAGMAAAAQLQDQVAFPSAMVDRITPATTQALIDECARGGVAFDRLPVETEAFSEWVIEQNTLGYVPDWGAAGAQWVDEVAPFEMRKLRLLNGTHTLMAHLGRWRGHRHVHEAIADPLVRRAVDALMAEASSTLDPVVRDDAASYGERLIERYANPALQHELAQIAVDSSLKLAVRIVPVLEQRAARGEASPACCAALAAWVAKTSHDLQAGCAVSDPAHAALQREASDAWTREAWVKAMLHCVGPTVATDTLVAAVLAAWPTQLAG
ncbi:MAG: mannitol dehydrogenase family protein [Pseudomonadota bacterium]